MYGIVLKTSIRSIRVSTSNFALFSHFLDMGKGKPYPILWVENRSLLLYKADNCTHRLMVGLLRMWL